MASVVVTGIGLLTALGPDRESCWKHVLAGETGIDHKTPWPAKAYPTDLVGAVDDAPLLSHLSKSQRRRLDRCHQLALVAAQEALADSGLALDQVDRARSGLFLGTSLGGMLSGMSYYRSYLKKGPRPHPGLAYYPFHVCLDLLSEATGFEGARSLVATACTASTLAAGQAYEAVHRGQVDRVLLGGVDPLCEFSFAGFSAMKNVSSDKCAPFSEPIGLSLGEGAAFFLLESEEAAKARGAKIYAWLDGYALGADAYHPTAPDPSGRNQKRLLREALGTGSLLPEDVDYINVHGTGTQANDICETNAIKEVFGDHAQQLAISSTKGATGHTLGAAGCVELAMTVMAVARDQVPPTANFTTPRDGCDLDYVPNQGRDRQVNHAISQNFAFGGNNAALVLSKSGSKSNGVEAVRDPDRMAVITGMGVIAPNAIGEADFCAALREGRSGLNEAADQFHDGQRSSLAGLIRDFNPARLTRSRIRRADRIGQLSVCAADMALASARLRVGKETADRIGVYIGTDRGPTGSCESFYREIATGGLRDADPKDFPNTVLNACSGLVAVNLRLRGPNIVSTVGSASGAQAIALAAQLIEAGKADVMIVGGCDELSPSVLQGFAAARQLSPHGPGERGEGLWLHEEGSNGLVLGEGAGFLVLESRSFARSRKAKILAEVAGYATGGAADRTGSAIGQVMKNALQMAGMDQVDLALSGAIGAPAIDRPESETLMEYMQQGVIAQAAALGGLFGVGGALPSLSACAAVAGMKEGFVPAGVRREQPLPDLPLTEGAAQDGQIGSALVNGLSLGGTTASLVIRQVSE